MAWNEDLARLKQTLGGEPVKPAPSSTPTPSPPKPSERKGLDEEDALFLAAMGLKPPPKVAETSTIPGKDPDVGFESAMKELKGLSAIQPNFPVQKDFFPLLSKKEAEEDSAAPTVSSASISETPEKKSPDAEGFLDPPLEPTLPTPSLSPVRISLAAGMAIEVDGSLDLRGHNLVDAMERLKDRLADAGSLGWRTLHVVLGPSQELHEGLLDFLSTSSASMITRYAQAPIPMGGSGAWILYLGTPSA